MSQKLLLIFVCISFIEMGCSVSKKAIQSKTEPIEITPLSYQFPYDLEQADVTFELPEILKEISGITLSTDKKQILAIQDENGILFYLDKKTGKVLREQTFHKDGDYEDIEVVGNDIFILKSSGTLYQLKETPVDTFTRIKYKTGYHKDHDMEGMCFDIENNRLLLACKGKLSRDNEFGSNKGVFGFDLNTMRMIDEPILMISLSNIESYLNIKGSPEMKERFEKIMTEKNGVLGFSPSAVAIHPQTKHIYMMSSKGKTLVVLKVDGTILHMQKLDKKIHVQPEGMLFDVDGTLYISNEGKKQNGRIYRFDVNQ